MTQAAAAFLYALKLCCDNGTWETHPYNTFGKGNILIERAEYCAKADMVIPFVDSGFDKYRAEIRTRKVRRCQWRLRKEATRLVEDCK